jgi:glutamate synthase domain-containing protein 1
VSKTTEIFLKQISPYHHAQVLYWRTVPTDRSVIGQVARNGEPFMRQVFVTWDNPAFTSPEDERIFLEKVRLYFYFYLIKSTTFHSIKSIGESLTPPEREQIDR